MTPRSEGGKPHPAGNRYGLCSLLLALITVLGAACGGATTSTGETVTLEEALRSSTAFQREVLSDGKLDYAEYESAVLATMSCLRNAGVEIVDGPTRAPGERLNFVFKGGPTREDADRVNDVYQRCYREYQDIVDIVWAQQHQPTEVELNEARQALARCLREAGVAVPDPAASEDLGAIARGGNPHFGPCSARISEQYDIPDFGG